MKQQEGDVTLEMAAVAADDGEVTTDRLDRMERLQRLELSAVFAAGLAHDLATPIQTLKANLAAVGEALKEVEDLARVMGLHPRGTAAITRGRAAAVALDEVSDYMHRLTRDFVRFSRGVRGATGHASVRGAIETAVRYTRTQLTGRAALALRLPRDLTAAIADRTLVRVIANLLMNAADAFREENPSRNWIVITSEVVGGKIVVEVADNAGGLSDLARQALFMPFAKGTQTERGLGLGLAVARALVREAGGELELVASGPMETRFRCTLPQAS